jgi:hypothetical protein
MHCLKNEVAMLVLCTMEGRNIKIDSILMIIQCCGAETLFPLRLRLSKSFGSGSRSGSEAGSEAGSGSDISFVTTLYNRFQIKKWIFLVFYERISI